MTGKPYDAPTLGRPSVWLVWALTDRGTVLRAICTAPDQANHLRRRFEEPDIVMPCLKAWVEQAALDHAFGDSMHGNAIGATR